MTPDLIVGIIIAIFASSGFWALILQVYNNHKKKKEDEGNESVERQALRSLLYKSLVDQCNSYLQEGHISVAEYKELNKYTYLPYKRLDGNGLAEKYMKQVEELINLTEV